ncbi:MAG: hypothetical protein FJ216_04530 [Ignavibacteria bacterium]|nr:hypothetical protein [Ignavibacteria bacterium]
MNNSTEQTITEQAIRLKKEKVIKGIVCPSCNGELDLAEGLKTFNCKYCGTLLAVKGLSGTLKYYVPKKINRDQAIQKAYQWLATGISKASGLAKQSQITDAFLVFIPYWRVTADVVGWVLGQEKRTRTTNNRTETYYVDVEKKIQQTYDNTFSACNVSELGVNWVNLMGDEIKAVDFDTLQNEGMVFNIISSEKEITDYAETQFKNSARSTARVDRISFEHYNLVRKNVYIVYYPLWIIRYQYQNKIYQVVVDGEDGSICYGKAPGNNLYRAVIGILGTVAGMFLITFLGGFLFGANKFSVGVFVVAFVAGFALISSAYKKFRYGAEIEEGTGIVQTGQPQKTKSKQKSQGTGFSASVLTEAANNIGISVPFGIGNNK